MYGALQHRPMVQCILDELLHGDQLVLYTGRQRGENSQYREQHGGQAPISPANLKKNGLISGHSVSALILNGYFKCSWDGPESMLPSNSCIPPQIDVGYFFFSVVTSVPNIPYIQSGIFSDERWRKGCLRPSSMTAVPSEGESDSRRLLVRCHQLDSCCLPACPPPFCFFLH